MIAVLVRAVNRRRGAIILLQQLQLVLSLIGPIGCAMIGGALAMQQWHRSGAWVLLLVPVGVIVFGVWWHRRWRQRWIAFVLPGTATTQGTGSGKDYSES